MCCDLDHYPLDLGITTNGIRYWFTLFIQYKRFPMLLGEGVRMVLKATQLTYQHCSLVSGSWIILEDLIWSILYSSRNCE